MLQKLPIYLGSAVLALGGVGAFLGTLSSSPPAVIARESASDGRPEQSLRNGAITVLAFGDMMFDRNVRKMIETNGRDYIFANIKNDPIFSGVDIVVANLEGAIASRAAPVKENDFAFSDWVVDLLQEINVVVVSLANNHTLDQGRSGLAHTKKILDQAGIKYFGDQVQDEIIPAMIGVRGKRMAFLAWNTTDNPVKTKTAVQAVREAQVQADYVIVFMHWGVEYAPKFRVQEQELAHALIDAGADAILGAHPHVVQGSETYNRRPIFYSLGNFVFDQYFSKETEESLAVRLVFQGSEIYATSTPLVSIKSQPRVIR